MRRVLDPETPERRYEEGLRAVYGGRFREAITRLGRVIALSPKNPKAYYFRGLALREISALPAAVADLSKALALDPSLVGAYYLRALALEELGDLVGALSDLDALLAAQPERLALHEHRARLLAALGRRREAEAALDKSLEKKPRSYFALVRRGALREERKDLKGSLEDYDEAIAMDPNLAPALLGKASLLFSLGSRARADEAVRLYTTAIERLPGRADLYAQRAYAHRKMYDYDKAVSDFTAAIGINPQVPDYWLARGHAYKTVAIDSEETAKLQLAILDLTKAIELAPKLSHGYLQRGNARIFLDQYDASAEDARSMLALNPRDSAAYSTLCQIYRHKKDFPKALENCDKAVDLDPYYSSARNSRALTLSGLGRAREALAESDKAVDFKPDWDETWRVRGMIKMNSGLRAEAAADFRKALDLNPGSAQLKRHLQQTMGGGAL